MRARFKTACLAAIVLLAACEVPTEAPFAETLAASNHLTFDCSAQGSIPEVECEALVAFYDATGGDTWTSNTGVAVGG